RTLARAQAELGLEVQVLCVNHRDRTGKDVTWETWATTPTERDRDGPVAVTRLGRRASLGRLDGRPELPGLPAGLRRRCDLLHLHNPNPTMTLALAWSRPRLPLVITHHSDVIKQRLLGLAFAPFDRMVYARAARLLSDSPTYQAGSPQLQ